MPVKKMILVMVITTIIAAAGGAAFYRSFSAVLFSIGLVLMTSVNIVKLFLMRHTIGRSLQYEVSADGKNLASLQYLIRLLLTGVFFLAVALITRHTEDFAAIWGGLIGAFTLQIAAISLKFMKSEDKAAETENS